MWYILLSLIHVAICVALIFFILIQSSKGMGLSGAFGAIGGSDSVFGSSGSINMVIKITITLGIIFALSSFSLSIIPPPRSSTSVINPSNVSIPAQIPSNVGNAKSPEAPAQSSQPSGPPPASGANPSGSQSSK